MSRLLTDEEMRACSKTEFGMVDRRPDVEKRLCQAQDAKTREATLKEVGEWLEREIVRDLMGRCHLANISAQDLEMLKQGKMPEEVK